MHKKPDGINGSIETVRFKDITFEDYGRRAIDSSLSENEKVGFPDAYRDGHADIIWQDLIRKLPHLASSGSRILDIGCGCGHLPQTLMRHATSHDQTLTLIDHPNMLSQLRDLGKHRLIPGQFPKVVTDDVQLADEKYNVIICYSVLHGVALESNPFHFIDSAVELLDSGGQLIFGDIPNFSKLRRFLASPTGRAFHKVYMQTDSDPDVSPFALDKARLDDGFILGVLTHLRVSGYDAYVLPQPKSLPLSTRREDILVTKP